MDPIRLQKADTLRRQGMQPYAASFDRTHELAAAKAQKDGTAVRVAGRIVLLRDMGKITFATLQDHTDRLQIAFREDELGEAYGQALALLDLGDFIGVGWSRFE